MWKWLQQMVEKSDQHQQFSTVGGTELLYYNTFPNKSKNGLLESQASNIDWYMPEIWPWPLTLTSRLGKMQQITISKHIF